MKSGAPVEHERQIAYQDVSAISNIYINRYRNNYALIGQAWSADGLWEADNAICMMLTGGDHE